MPPTCFPLSWNSSSTNLVYLLPFLVRMWRLARSSTMNPWIWFRWRCHVPLFGTLIVRFSGPTTTWPSLKWKTESESFCYLCHIHVFFRQSFWLDLYRNMQKEYFPFKMYAKDYYPCSFTPIFAMPGTMSMYYRKLWVEVTSEFIVILNVTV